MFHNKDYIYCIYRERSFSKAAEKLHISQPSLSATVRKIEDQAGTPIFERKTRPVSLTPFGVEYVQGIEQIYEIEEHLHNMVYELRTFQSGSISVGGSNLDVPYVIPQKIARFNQNYPNVTLRVVAACTEKCKAMLDSGDLDIMITNRPLDINKYARVVCYRENLVLAVPKSFSVNQGLEDKRLSVREMGREIFDLPEERSVSLENFASVPFVLLHSGNYLRLCCDAMFQECSTTPRVVLEVEESSVAYNFANFGVGAAIISSVLVEYLQHNSSCWFYKLSSKRAVRDAYLYYRRGRYVTAAMKKFIQNVVDL